ncbi:MAG: flagellar protein FliS [Planctomycetota bacterium]
MEPLQSYQRKKIQAGWSRVDLLLMLYEKAIEAVDACEIAAQTGDQALYVKHEMTARKVFLAIHSGLKPDEDEVAFNIARLLHFVLLSFDERRFDDCKRILDQVRQGFARIADEANELERSGAISPLAERDSFESIA